MIRLITTILVIGASQTSYAGIYDLKFRRVAPLADQETCRVFIEQTASEFGDQSGASIIDYGCREDDFTREGWDAVITYQAPTRLTVTSTYTTPLYSAAFYSSHADCSEQLPLQRQLFADATGLQPLASYCMLDIASGRKWETRVDGLGQSVVFPDTAAVPFWGTIVNEESVFADYRTAAEGYGISVFEAGISRDMGGKIVLKLYATAHYSIEDYDAMEYESVEACFAAASEVRDILDSADKPVVVFCEENTDSPFRNAILHTTALVKTLEPESVFEARALTSQFGTLDACEQVSGTIDGDSADIFGSVCAGVGEDFRIHLFTRP